MPRYGLLLLCALALVLPASAQAQSVDLPAVGRACDEARLGPQEKVLVFSETTAFRHDSIPAGREAICRAAGQDGIAVDWTEDSAAFAAGTLAQYDAVVFLSTTGDALDAAAAGRVRGLHPQAAAATPASTPRPTPSTAGPGTAGWSAPYFDSHPAIQEATVEVSDRKHPSTAHLPQRWQRDDEWYTFRSNPRGDVHVLATLDETSYTGGAMGVDHPIAWCHELRRRARLVHGRRSHRRESYDEARLPRRTCSAASSGRPTSSPASAAAPTGATSSA